MCVGKKAAEDADMGARAQAHTVCTVSADVACVLNKAQIKRVRAR